MKKYLVLLVAVILIAAAYAYQARTAVPADNACYDLLVQSLETARTNGTITVPAFDSAQLTHIRCAARPGFTQFELVGKDTAGMPFRIYLVSGGRAASGADTIFNYCYQQGGTLRSGTRITGRAGIVSEPDCTYDGSFMAEETYFFDQGFF